MCKIFYIPSGKNHETSLELFFNIWKQVTVMQHAAYLTTDLPSFHSPILICRKKEKCLKHTECQLP